MTMTDDLDGSKAAEIVDLSKRNAVALRKAMFS
ncbi:Lsr2 family protein [Nakamurella alba]|nr:Lsr2 family protein [Nakamurella alba]